MKKSLLLMLIMLDGGQTALTQGLKTTGSAVDQLVPAGWHHQEALGDLNHDGYNDVVLVATPEAKDSDEVSPILAIYFGSQPGQLKLWRQYEDLIPADDENIFFETEVTVTDRGVLRIEISSFSSVGSSWSEWRTSVFRFQDNDFFLIGMDKRSMSRMTGEEITESFNYLTNRCQRIVDNVFNEDVKPRETWRRIPKRPLHHMGKKPLF